MKIWIHLYSWRSRALLPPDLYYLRVGLIPERSGEEAMGGLLMAKEPPESSESGAQLPPGQKGDDDYGHEPRLGIQKAGAVAGKRGSVVG